MKRLVLLLMLGFIVTVPAGCMAEGRRVPGERPNILLILVDDMRADDLKHMPKTKALLAREGTTFERAYVTQSVCCPSRTTILRGQYPHNHRVLSNLPPLGGYRTFEKSGKESSTVATWLNGAGYETALVGKYLNGYREARVPPGWDEWYGWAGFRPGGFEVNENGELKSYRHSRDNATAVLSRRAVSFVGKARSPFFLYFAPTAAHAGTLPTELHEDDFAGARAPRSPSFNEADVSDKPGETKKRRRLSPSDVADIDEKYRTRLRTLQDADDAVEKLVAELEETGELSSTYIVFTSDNGYHMGEHRLPPGKTYPYEEDIRVPLVISGPDVPDGASRRGFALNNDLAPTFAEWAGIDPPALVDGRSLVPLIDGAPREWRTGFLVEKRGDPDNSWWGYRAVRTDRWLYVEYGSEERELYDMEKDPRQLSNIHGEAGPMVLKKLEKRIDALKDCAGGKCTRAENR